MADPIINLDIRPPKTARQDPDWNQCLCHVRTVTGTLTKFTPQSWTKLRQSAEERKDFIYDQLKGHWNEGPAGGYHRPCYQTYTNKTLIQRLLSKRGTLSPNVSSVVRPSTSRPSRTRKLPLKAACIICQKAQRRSGSKLEILSQCLTTQASEKLLEAAKAKQDERILLELRGIDLIAAKIKYHKTCYGGYTRSKNTTPIKQDDCEVNAIYEATFQHVVNYVTERIIDGLDVMRMTNLRDMYIDLLAENGIESPNYRTEKLKRRLIKHFGNSLEFWQPQRMSDTEIIYSKAIRIGQAVEASAATIVTQAELPSLSPTVQYSQIQQVFLCAKIIRAELLAVKNNIPWPPMPDDLTEDHIQVPDLVYNLLAWVLCGDSDEGAVSSSKPNLPDSSHRHVLSIAQDLLHCVSRGRVKTPKHVVLPMTVRHLTRSSQLVGILNHLGHGLSNSQIQEVETSFKEIGKYLSLKSLQ